MEAEVNWARDYVFLGNDEAGHTIVFDSYGGERRREGDQPHEGAAGLRRSLLGDGHSRHLWASASRT